MPTNAQALNDRDEDRATWRLVREVPLAVIVGLIIQAAALIWWTSYWTTDLSNRVSYADKNATASALHFEERIHQNSIAIEDLRRERDTVVELKTRMVGIETLMKEVRDELRATASRR